MRLRSNRQAIALIAVTLAIGVSSTATAADPPPRPNVIFILADDKCYDALRISHEPLKSPRIT
jgi:hypothetical protein